MTLERGFEPEGELAKPGEISEEDFIAYIRRKAPFIFMNGALEFVVRMAGFEPTTLWFVARYSIQLSYIRVSKSAEPVY